MTSTPTADEDTTERPPAHTQRHRGAVVRRRRSLLLGGIAVLTVLGVVLVVAGLSVVRNSTLGRSVTAAGPDEPGYRAGIVATPTLGVLLVGDDGSLAGAAVLALTPDDASGTVVQIPSALVVDDDADGMTLAEAYRSGGAAEAGPMLARALNATVDHVVAIDGATWEQMLEPVGAVELTLQRPVAGWDAGEVRLPPEDVDEFLAAVDDDEDDIARMGRQQLFWEAWLAAVRYGGASALPGEVGSGIGRFVDAIATGEGIVVELPVIRVDDSDDDAGEAAASTFAVDRSRLSPFVAGAIPYPLAPVPGSRIRVRVLNGSGDPELLTVAARELVAAGAEIVVVGNPDPLEQPDTLFVPATGERERLADWLQNVVGGGRVEVVPPESTAGAAGDEIDVTVILGQDAGEIFGREQTSD